MAEDRPSLFKKQPRPMEELLRDSGFPFQVGRLVGASIMVSYWMSLRDDAEANEMGKKFEEVIGWFFVAEPAKEAKK